MMLQDVINTLTIGRTSPCTSSDREKQIPAGPSLHPNDFFGYIKRVQQMKKGRDMSDETFLTRQCE